MMQRNKKVRRAYAWSERQGSRAHTAGLRKVKEDALKAKFSDASQKHLGGHWRLFG